NYWGVWGSGSSLPHVRPSSSRTSWVRQIRECSPWSNGALHISRGVAGGDTPPKSGTTPGNASTGLSCFRD
ncbi:hypothetical protein TNCV_4277191, partial [Trichonephila clavipes]